MCALGFLSQSFVLVAFMLLKCNKSYSPVIFVKEAKFAVEHLGSIIKSDESSFVLCSSNLLNYVHYSWHSLSSLPCGEPNRVCIRRVR